MNHVQPASQTFYLVRHAHADWVPDENRPLSPAGWAAAERVAGLLVVHPITAIVSSPYARARQTVEPLAALLGLPIHDEPDLRERALGVGATGDFAAVVAAMWRDPEFAHPNGESNRAAQARGLAALRRLRSDAEGAHIVLGTHGNLLALILQAFDPAVDYAFWQSLTMPDVYRLRLDATGQPTVDRLWGEALLEERLP